MNKIAIRIDLSTFFEDERKLVFIMVDPSWENIECLQKRVEYLFNVDSVRFVNSDGCFLPPQEPVEILKFCRGLKAFVPKESLEKSRRKKSKKSKNFETSFQESELEDIHIDNNNFEGEDFKNDESQKKRRHSSLESGKNASSTPYLTKRPKNCNDSTHGEYVNKSSEITSTSEQMPPQAFVALGKNKKSKNNLKTSLITSHIDKPMTEKYSEILKFEETAVMTNADVTENENTLFQKNPNKTVEVPTYKVRKNSGIMQHKLEKTFNDEMKTTAPRSSSIPSSTFINEIQLMEQCKNYRKSGYSLTESNKGHIYFNESGEIVSTTSTKEKQLKTVIIFRCPLNAVTNSVPIQKPRIFKIKPTGSPNKQKKELVEIQEDIILPPYSKLIASNETPSIDKIDTEHAEFNKIDKNEDESNFSNQRSSNTNVRKNAEEVSDNTLEVSIKKEETETQNDSIQTSSAIESSIISVDCVDLSIDLDEEDEGDKKENNANKLKLPGEKHDLTKDDKDNSSDIEEIPEIIDLNETEDNLISELNKSKSQARLLKDIRFQKTNKIVLL